MSGGNSLTSNTDIEISNQDGVATMRLRRPRVRNAITLAMWEATASLFAGFGADE
jgi:enoyl-CoA hydratase/carnithine racemase